MIRKTQTGKFFLPTEISTPQAVDTGMAMVLIGLLAYIASSREVFLFATLGLLLANMILPRIFVPVAKLWLGLGALLGAIMSRVIMTVIFLCIVCPIAIIRRIAGGDSLQLKKWKAGRASAFTQKSHTYSSEDIHKPY